MIKTQSSEEEYFFGSLKRKPGGLGRGLGIFETAAAKYPDLLYLALLG